MSKLSQVIVFCGGISSERAISLVSGKMVGQGLSQGGFAVLIFDTGTGKLVGLEKIKELSPKPYPNLPTFPLKEIKKAKAVFIALHGPLGEDGTIQGMLELLGIPYVGSGVLASALAINKKYSKEFFELAGLPTPPAIFLKKEKKDFPQKLAVILERLPIVVKPVSQGSSIGVTIVKKKKELEGALKRGFAYGKELLIEPYIRGEELTVGILEDKRGIPQPLPVVEIIPQKQFFNYEAKYDGTTLERVPAKIPPKIKKLAQKIALGAHQVLCCRHLSRADMIWDKKENVYLLEVNTIPGLTAQSLFPKAARAAGFSFPELLKHLVNLATKSRSQD